MSDHMILADRLQPGPLPFDDVRAQTSFVTLQSQAARSEVFAPLADLLKHHQTAHDFLKAVFTCSPFLGTLALRETDYLQVILLNEPDQCAQTLLEDLSRDMKGATSHADAMRILRTVKRRVALLTALADLGGVWSVEETTAALSRAADALTAEAVRFLLREVANAGTLVTPSMVDPAIGSGYIVLAMGKHGAHELNYSSDIDLIVLFDGDAAPLKAGVEPAPFFVRLTRNLIKLLQERTADGYVFRTDLRLRPDPGSTQIAISTSAAFQYYESAGQNWERAAFIKARAVAGDITAGAAFLRALSPFVWRKYLDYAAIADIHAMKRQIHAFKGHAAVTVAGHNLKLGRGGIREIEFFVQTQQLIAGGRQPDLRASGTLDALQALATRGWITESAALELSNAYCFLRHIEHRLQMINDEQTHTLPSDPEGLRRVSNFCGFAEPADFAAALTAQLNRVQNQYIRLFESVPELTSSKVKGSLVFTGVSDDPATLVTLAEMGFTYPASVVATVRGWHFGRYPAMRSARARERLTEVTPALLEALSQTANPDQALVGFDMFMSELPSGVQLFALLRNNPSLLDLIADIMGSAPRLARVLSKSRRVLDAVLDPGFLRETHNEHELCDFLKTQIASPSDYEEALNRARIVGREQAFLIGARVLSGGVAPEAAAEAYTALADGLIAALQMQVETLMDRTHGRIPGGEAAILAMGKLGGREMTAASDLDLLVIYDYGGATVSTGLKPLPPSMYYSRYTQRLISALSAQTSEGRLYEVDMRLRPSGNAGPVATSLAAFSDYQNERAWTWEHMALTRARVVAGPPGLTARLGEVIQAVLAKTRDVAKIGRDVREMRGKLATHKSAKSIWDLKQVRGGLVDIEFIAQYLQLVHAAQSPGVLSTSTVAAFAKLRDAGHLSLSDASVLISAAGFFNSLTQIVRLCLEEQFNPMLASVGLKARLAKSVGAPDFDRLNVQLADTLAGVSAIYDRIILA
ncbi:MAG: bifunctional [glutamine synthetase] adenylyltransferase/[glutamine synthetase]-adenylyl-L-tyrosine phosphorylase [Chitinophagales bacterium]|nr:bifunctional [glutamine synthetase] adenylyltransferase/[glutamine synthetase]-adenylyl-L-tyrosine phosphorylase [Hyphomicrobiales bacterium]